MKIEMQLGGDQLSLETGKVAKQADGAVWVQYGDTVVLVTVVAEKTPTTLDFFPLTVDYRERYYAIGKIPGVYGRREPRPGISETLTARLIDHCIRPLFPKDYGYEVQVMATTLACDKVHPPEVVAMIGASAALSISDVPFDGPVGAVIVGRIDGEFIVNPVYDQLDKCDMHFFITGTKEAIMSVEGDAYEAPEDEVIDALEFAHEHIKELVTFQEALVQTNGTPKRAYEVKPVNDELTSRTRALATSRIQESIGIDDKQDRDDYLEGVVTDILAELAEEYGPDEYGAEEEHSAREILSKIEKEEMRRSILDNGRRVDGRGVKDVRPISCEAGVLPRVHGSALFSRGQTQSLATVTLGSKMDENMIRDMQGERSKAFFLHYNFPPFSVGEVRPIRGPGRREIGHGSLAEHAVMHVMPSKEDFSYTVRVVSEILESNASSSMATVCAASLALMDAGVPIKSHVAGVGVGLIKEGDQEVILTDMLGAEDFLGDMDFKVAGTEKGITAIQMDIKITGVTTELMRRAIHQACEARLFVLGKMAEAIQEPRGDISPHAPRIYKIKIHPDKIREVIGPRGRVVQGIQEETGVQISIEDDGTVEIAATSVDAAKLAEDKIWEIAAMPEVDKEYVGKVTRTTNFGAFVQILPGKDGMVHISQMSDGYIRRVEDVMHVGDEARVRVLSIDENGRVDLTLTEKFAGEEREDGGSSDSRGSRGGHDSRNSRGSRGSRSSRDSRGGGRPDRDDRHQGGGGKPRIPKNRF